MTLYEIIYVILYIDLIDSPINRDNFSLNENFEQNIFSCDINN
jgi:hypothetical protein